MSYHTGILYVIYVREHQKIYSRLDLFPEKKTCAPIIPLVLRTRKFAILLHVLTCLWTSMPFFCGPIYNAPVIFLNLC
jgi:hypothetical protein